MKKVMLVLLISLFYISFASAVIPGDCNPTPISYWKFDSSVSDSASGNNDGTWIGTSGYGALKVGNGARFLESNSIEITDSGDLSFSGDFSVEMWIRSDVSSLTSYILNKNDYKVQWVDEGLFGSKYILATVDGITVQSEDLSSNTPYFVVLKWDGSSTITLYINGANPVTGSLGSLTPSTDKIILGSGFIGLVDELAIYNTALTTTQISNHYAKSSGGDDYCYTGSGGDGSDTQKNFTLLGCEIPGSSLTMPINSCFRGEPYNGMFYCDGDGVKQIHDTRQDPGYCNLQTPSCCPVNFRCRICEADEDGCIDNDNEYCYQRTTPCSSYTEDGQSVCETEACYWIDDECVDPNDPSLSCSIYTKKDLCEEDIWSLGQLGAGTEICGTFTSTGMVIPRESCMCVWVLGDEECVFSYSVENEFYGPGNPDGFFNCLKSFETEACVDGKQNVSWNVSVSGYTDPPSQEDLDAAECNNDSVIRNCGQPIVTVPFFGFWNLIVVCLLICLFYMFYREDL